MTTATVRITKKGVDRWKAGHPWIYAADCEKPPATLQGGEVVRVEDGRGWFLGLAFFSRDSKITLRWLSWEDVAVDRDFFRARLVAADALRQRACPDETAYRVVHGEADLLPGLVVDRFGEYLSVQFLHKATEQRKALLTELLAEQFKPKAIINRSDANVRRLEGLEPEKGVLFGDAPGPITYREGHVTIETDLLTGQKTGAFLDQRDKLVIALEWALVVAIVLFI